MHRLQHTGSRKRRRWKAVTTAVLAGLAALVAVLDIGSLTSHNDSIFQVSVGGGLYLAIFAALSALASGIVSATRSP